MRIEYSPDEQLLYLRLGAGEVAHTVELEPNVYVDLDAAGAPLGVEFLNAADLLPFIARHGGALGGPDDIAAALAERRAS